MSVVSSLSWYPMGAFSPITMSLVLPCFRMQRGQRGSAMRGAKGSAMKAVGAAALWAHATKSGLRHRFLPPMMGF